MSLNMHFRKQDTSWKKKRSKWCGNKFLIAEIGLCYATPFLKRNYFNTLFSPKGSSITFKFFLVTVSCLMDYQNFLFCRLPQADSASTSTNYFKVVQKPESLFTPSIWFWFQSTRLDWRHFKEHKIISQVVTYNLWKVPFPYLPSALQMSNKKWYIWWRHKKHN